MPSELRPGIGSIVRVSGTGKELLFYTFDGDFDFREYLGRKGCFTEIAGAEITYLLRIPDLGGAYRDWCLQSVDGDARSLISSFLFAKGGGGIEGYDSLVRGGSVHFLTGTSLHLHLVFSGIERLAGKRGRKASHFIPVALASFICFTSDFSLTGKRVLLLSIAGVVSSRRGAVDRVSARMWSGVALLATAPFSAADPAFYYPYAMVLFGAVTPTVLEGRNRISRKLVQSALAAVYLLPLLLSQEGSANLLSLFLSLLMTGPSCFLYLILMPAYLIPPWAAVASPAADLYLGVIRSVTDVGTVWYGQFQLVFAILWYAVLLVFLFLQAIGVKRAAVSLSALPLILAMPPLLSLIPVEQVVFIYVGQGDATLVRSGGSNVLIDTGGSLYDDIAQECLIPMFKRMRISYLDAVIITHRDNDHYGALDSLVSSFPVERVIYGSDVFGEFDAGGITFYDHNGRSGSSNENQNSAVLSFTVGRYDLLVMGDADAAVEREIIARGDDLSADILRVGHHGSSTSTTEELLDAVDPSRAVISCGKNSYGHPTSAVLERLYSRGIDVWRTDRDGTLILDC